MATESSEDFIYNQMVVTPEFVTHPLLSNLIRLDPNDNRLILPLNVLRFFESKRRMKALIPFVEDESNIKSLEKIPGRIVFTEIHNQKGYEISKSNLLERLKDFRRCRIYDSIEFAVELLSYSAADKKPLLMARSSVSRFMKFIETLNDWLHIFHQPALFKLIDGDKAFPDRIKEYAETKLKVLEPLVTRENRGALIWAGTFIIVGHVFLETTTLGVHTAWFVCYDP